MFETDAQAVRPRGKSNGKEGNARGGPGRQRKGRGELVVANRRIFVGGWKGLNEDGGGEGRGQPWVGV